MHYTARLADRSVAVNGYDRTIHHGCAYAAYQDLSGHVSETHRIPFTYDDTVPELIARRRTELKRGARMVDALVTNMLLPEIGREFLHRLANGSEARRVHVGATNGNFSFAFE